MTSTGVWFVICVAVATLFFRRWMLDALIDGINEIADSFRGGGPPTPMHPSPANDGALLRRRSRKIER
ncbi:MAG: hypothetical protein LAP61_04935 [Acidobacteriia bacterium]|nr:hypothetical protein [Terriglobia bacterium]